MRTGAWPQRLHDVEELDVALRYQHERDERKGRIGEISINSPAGVPVSPLKTLLPLAAFMLLLQGIAETIRCVLCMRTGAWPQRLHDVEELDVALRYQHERDEAPEVVPGLGGKTEEDPR